MQKMLEKTLATAIIAAGVALAHPAAADSNPSDQPSQNEPGVASASVITASATIQKIDKTKRTVTLKGSDGDEMEVKVGGDVNLDRLRTGDMVNATYYEEVAVAVRKSEHPNPKVTRTTIDRGGVTAQQTTLTAQIVSVDEENHKVAIRGAEGRTHMLKVQDPGMQSQLSKIKKGDNVELTYTQAVAMTIEPQRK